MSDTDRKALLTAAIDALTRAADACAAAGVPTTVWSVTAGTDLLAFVGKRATEALALLTAAEQPIAIGDTVRILDERHERTETLVKIGRKHIHTDRGRYSIEHGRGSGSGSGYGKIIHPHDLARIQRWLVKPARGAR